MCGEKAFRFLFSGLTEGSPPHVRGKVPEYLGGGRYHGITPACAGKRSAVRNSHQWNQDHPRMCGEKITKVKNNQQAMGSPPHVRGKGSTTTAWTLSARITPSHAGKSCTFRRPRWRSRDHPRIRGEKLFVQLPDNRQRGSPPHVRGKVVHLAIVPCGEGITPACAGKRLKRSRSTVPHAAIVPLFPSVCNKPAGSDGNPAGHDAPPFLPIENAAPASPAYNLRSL